MAANKHNKRRTSTSSKGAGSAKQPGQVPSWLSVRNQIIICVLLAVGLYANTIGHGYALDDGLVIHENPNTQRGLAGIPEILSSDSYEHYYAQFGATGELPGGRYRPLSVVTFAIEWELFAENPTISHLINVLLYGLTAWLLVLLLNRHLFPKRPLLAFAAVVVFVIHPIHTEVVANIKSRDELLALIFLILTLNAVFRYARSNQVSHVLWACGFYFLALLSKENGITFLAVAPLALFCFTKLKPKRIAQISWPLVVVAATFIAIRASIVQAGSTDSVMNDPFLLAGPGEKLPTIFAVLLHYIRLLFWPHPLSFDYGYNHFEYVGFTDPATAVSLLLHLGLLAGGIWGVLRKKAWAFGVMFYFITISIVSNLVVPIGATMGERLAYLPSLGFAIAFAAALLWVLRRLTSAHKVSTPTAVVLAAIVLAAGYKTVTRNADWKNNNTLFIGDVSKVPRSIKANISAATEYVNAYDQLTGQPVDDTHLQNAIVHLNAAIDLHKGIPRGNHFPDMYLNLGGVYHRLGQFEEAAQQYLIVNENNGWFVTNQASVIQTFTLASDKAVEQTRLSDAEMYLKRALLHDPNNLDATYKLGGVYFGMEDYQRARQLYESCTVIAPNNGEVWMNLGGFYYTIGDYAQAVDAFGRSVQLQPENVQAQQGLAAARQALGG